MTDWQPSCGARANVKVIDGTKLNSLQLNGEIADSSLLDNFFIFDAIFTGGVFVGASKRRSSSIVKYPKGAASIEPFVRCLAADIVGLLRR